MFHTILGSSGIIGTELARELDKRGKPLRLVSRKPKDLHLGEDHLPTDLLDADGVKEAVRGSEVVYLTAGLTYDSRVWRKQWPKIILNTVAACREHGARLVFFDNVYMYGPVEGFMTEKTPLRPESEKGKIRAGLQQMLLDEAKKGDLDIRIGISADFYGPQAQNGIPNLLIFANLAKGKNPQWMASGKHPHSLTYTRDAALGMAELGLREELPEGERVWHLPTAPDPLTAEEVAREAAKALSVAPKPVQVLKPWMIGIGGLFQRQIYELGEMMYQYDRDYLFSSAAFEKAFGIKPTPYVQGIWETAESYRP
jgi:nucleoside-diphosphate-sugar epimerase